MRERKQNVFVGPSSLSIPSFVWWSTQLPSGTFILNPISRRSIGAPAYSEPYALALSFSIYIIHQIWRKIKFKKALRLRRGTYLLSSFVCIGRPSTHAIARAPTTYQAPLSLLDPALSMRSPTDLRRLRRHLSCFSLISSAKPAVIVPAWKDFQII